MVIPINYEMFEISECSYKNGHEITTIMRMFGTCNEIIHIRYCDPNDKLIVEYKLHSGMLLNVPNQFKRIKANDDVKVIREFNTNISFNMDIILVNSISQIIISNQFQTDSPFIGSFYFYFSSIFFHNNSNILEESAFQKFNLIILFRKIKFFNLIKDMIRSMLKNFNCREIIL